MHDGGDPAAVGWIARPSEMLKRDPRSEVFPTLHWKLGTHPSTLDCNARGVAANAIRPAALGLEFELTEAAIVSESVRQPSWHRSRERRAKHPSTHSPTRSGNSLSAPTPSDTEPRQWGHRPGASQTGLAGVQSDR